MLARSHQVDSITPRTCHAGRSSEGRSWPQRNHGARKQRREPAPRGQWLRGAPPPPAHSSRRELVFASLVQVVFRFEVFQRASLALSTAVILGAALVKVYTLATAPFLESLQTSPIAMGALAAVELLFSIWMVRGRGSRFVKWCAVLSLFSLFAVISAAKVLRGDLSCGCFGVFSPSPSHMLAIDIGLVVLLLLSRPSGVSERSVECHGWTATRITCVWVGLVMISGAVVWGSRLRVGSGVEESTARNGTEAAQETGLEILGRSVCLPDGRKAVLLEPERWVGKRLPLLPYIRPSWMQKKLTMGTKRVAVILVRRDCNRCQELIASLENNEGSNSVGPERLYLETSSSTRYLDGKGESSGVNAMWGYLCSEVDWYVETPVILVISGTRVVRVDVRRD